MADLSKLNKIEKLRKEVGEVKFEPMPGLIIARLFNPEAFKKTKLHLPDGMKNKSSDVYSEMPLQGIVVAVGEDFVSDLGVKRPIRVRKGDHIALDPGSRALEFIYHKTNYAYFRASDVVGIYRGVDVPMRTSWMR